MKRLVRLPSFAFTACALLIGCAAHAADAVASSLQHTLQARFPTIKVDAVEPSPIPGIYQVFAGNAIVYVDASGDHMIVGKMMDTRTKQNLSEEAMDEHESIDFNSLPLGEAIRIVKGNGARKIAVFEDPDCPYCRRLEQDDLAAMTDMTIYLFLLPLTSVHPHALEDSKAIWCSPDRASAWTGWMLSSTWMTTRTPMPTGGSCAGDPIGKIQVLAQKLRVNATPTLFLENGRRIGGFLPREQLESLLAQAAQPGSHRVSTSSQAVPN